MIFPKWIETPLALLFQTAILVGVCAFLLPGCVAQQSKLGGHSASKLALDLPVIQRSDNPSPYDPYRHENLRYVFDDGALPKITISISEENLNKKLRLYDQNPRHEEEVRANFRFEKNGVVDTVKLVGFRLKGNSSRARIAGNRGEAFDPKDPNWHQAGFVVDFNQIVKDQHFRGLKKINLRYLNGDPSFIRTAYSENLMRRFGVWSAPLASYVRLYLHVEGQKKPAYFGIYQIVEPIDKIYLQHRFGVEPLGFLWKCTFCTLAVPFDEATTGVESVSSKDDDQSTRPYFDLKTRKKKQEIARSQLVDFIHDLNYLPSEKFESWAESHIDVDLFLKALAVRTALGDWDGHWINDNNYYLYFRKVDGKLIFVPHDFDNTLAIGGFVENPVTQNPFYFGAVHMGKPLIYRFLNHPAFRQRYATFLSDLVDEEKGLLHPNQSNVMVRQLLNVIDPKRNAKYIKNDTDAYQNILDKNLMGLGDVRYSIIPDGEYLTDEKVNVPNFFKVRSGSLQKAVEENGDWTPYSRESSLELLSQSLFLAGTFNEWLKGSSVENISGYEFKKMTPNNQSLEIQLKKGPHQFALTNGVSERSMIWMGRGLRTVLRVDVKADHQGIIRHYGNNTIGVYPYSQDKKLLPVTLVAPVDGLYSLDIDYKHPEIVLLNARLIDTKTTENELKIIDSHGETIYLRGDFNHWLTTHPMNVLEKGRRLEVTLYILEGTHKFKFADALWKHIDLGAAQGDEVVLQPGMKTSLYSGFEPADLFVKIREPGYYQFIIENPDFDQPTMLVKTVSSK